MSDALRPRPESVRVVFAAPTQINALPHRLDIWLLEIRHSGGQIKLTDPATKGGQTRGLFGIGIIFDLLAGVEALHDQIIVAERLALIHGYDAQIVYDHTNGNASEVVLKLQHPAPTN